MISPNNRSISTPSISSVTSSPTISQYPSSPTIPTVSPHKYLSQTYPPENILEFSNISFPKNFYSTQNDKIAPNASPLSPKCTISMSPKENEKIIFSRSLSRNRSPLNQKKEEMEGTKRVLFDDELGMVGVLEKSNSLPRRRSSRKIEKKTHELPLSPKRAANLSYHNRTQSANISPLQKGRAESATSESMTPTGSRCSSPKISRISSRNSWKPKKPKNFYFSFPVKNVISKFGNIVDHVNTSWFGFLVEDCSGFFLEVEKIYEIAKLKPALMEMEHFDPWAAVFWILIKKISVQLKSIEPGNLILWDSLKWKSEKFESDNIFLKFEVQNGNSKIKFFIFIGREGNVNGQRTVV